MIDKVKGNDFFLLLIFSFFRNFKIQKRNLGYYEI